MVKNVNIRIKIHILSLHWMMKTMSYFNVSEKPFGLHRQDNFNPLINVAVITLPVVDSQWQAGQLFLLTP